MASASGTVVKAGSGGVIIDDAGRRWTISPWFTVQANGRPIGFTAHVTEIAYVTSIVWHVNTSGQWYSWNGAAWIAGSDPTALNTVQITTLLSQILAHTKELLAMSGTLGTDIANLTTDVAALTAGVGAMKAAVDALIAKLNASNPTPEQVAAIEAADAAVKQAVSDMAAETAAAQAAGGTPPA